MGLDVDYIAGKQAIDKLAKLLSDTNHGEREKVADDIIKMVYKLIKKYEKPKPKKVERLSIGDLRRKLEYVNFKQLSESEMSDKNVLEKMIEWQDDYTHIPWEKFRNSYFKCSDCGHYDNEPCICYAR